MSNSNPCAGRKMTFKAKKNCKRAAVWKWSQLFPLQKSFSSNLMIKLDSCGPHLTSNGAACGPRAASLTCLKVMFPELFSVADHKCHNFFLRTINLSGGSFYTSVNQQMVSFEQILHIFTQKYFLADQFEIFGGPVMGKHCFKACLIKAEID
jgi:hypothetical protein